MAEEEKKERKKISEAQKKATRKYVSAKTHQVCIRYSNEEWNNIYPYIKKYIDRINEKNKDKNKDKKNEASVGSFCREAIMSKVIEEMNRESGVD